MARRLMLLGGGVALVVVLCASMLVAQASPHASGVVGPRLSALLVDTPVPFLTQQCATYPLWERWGCATQPVVMVDTVATSGATCVSVLPQWRVERELQARSQRQRPGAAASGVP